MQTACRVNRSSVLATSPWRRQCTCTREFRPILQPCLQLHTGKMPYNGQRQWPSKSQSPTASPSFQAGRDGSARRRQRRKRIPPPSPERGTDSRAGLSLRDMFLSRCKREFRLVLRRVATSFILNTGTTTPQKTPNPIALLLGDETATRGETREATGGLLSDSKWEQLRPTRRSPPPGPRRILPVQVEVSLAVTLPYDQRRAQTSDSDWREEDGTQRRARRAGRPTR